MRDSSAAMRREWPLQTAIFFDLAAFTIVLVDFQFRAEEFGIPGLWIGALLASTFLVQLLASPRWGLAADRLGRKRVFLACTLFSLVSMVLYAVASGPWWLLLSRLAAGLGAANTAVAQAAVSDAYPEADRAGPLGRLAAAQNLGLILGPSLGGFFSDAFGSPAAGWLAAGCSAASLLVAAAFAVMPAGPVESEPRRLNLFGFLKEAPGLAPLLLASTTAWFSLAMLEGTFGRLISRTLGLGRQEFGVIFAFESVIGVVMSALVLAWIMKRAPSWLVLGWSFLAMGVGLAFMPFAPAYGWLFVASAAFAAGQGLSGPAVNVLAAAKVREGRHGELFGVMQGARAVGFLIGPLIGGAFFDVFPAGPYLVAGGACLAAATVVAVFLRPRTGNLSRP
ncbi:MAG: MFS transporter [Fimbriimonadaceae bacterium]|nr:MFS transporter [Fimbriimonadaceae bacterium]